MALFSKPTARALAVIDLLMANPQQAFGLTEMTKRLKLNKATCHAILTTMKSYGFLHQDPKSKAYRLGPSMAAAGHTAFTQFPALSYAKPELKMLAEQTGLDASIVARSSSNLITLAHYKSAASGDTVDQTGFRLPNIAPLGACFIAWSPAVQLTQWIQQAHQSQGSYNEQIDQQMRIAVISIHKRGFEINLKTDVELQWVEYLKNTGQLSQEHIKAESLIHQKALCEEEFHLNHIDRQASYDVRHIAVPVFGCGPTPELTLNVSTTNKTLNGADIEAIAEKLRQASKRITQATKESLPGITI